ncbi:hypothetical protein PTI98_000594 [Pleurotus ostreatus]|nr:hypothetical protein PTI98_000594 [Pleurotus ostreatus]
MMLKKSEKGTPAATLTRTLLEAGNIGLCIQTLRDKNRHGSVQGALSADANTYTVSVSWR